MKRSVRAGWRYFKCEDCGAHWKEQCRDHATPSQSECINYFCESREFGGVEPYHSEPDEKIMTDKFGNLWDPPMMVKIGKNDEKTRKEIFNARS